MRALTAAGATTVVALVALSGCASSQPEVAQREPGTVPSASASPGESPGESPSEGSGAASSSPAPPASPSSPASTSPTSSTSSGPVECTADDVSATYAPGDSGAGSTFGAIVLENTSDRACFTRGYGGLSYVGGGDGEQVGAAATRDDKTPVRRVVLQPGEHASSGIREVSARPYPRDECRPTPVDGFRVYVPDETESLYVAHPTTGCADDDVSLLSHQAYAPA